MHGVVFYDFGSWPRHPRAGGGREEKGTGHKDREMGKGRTNKVPISVRIRHGKRPKKREKRVVTSRGFKIGPNRISLAETNEF